MFCSSCGNNVANNSKFCDSCGAPMPVSNSVAPQQAQANYINTQPNVGNNVNGGNAAPNMYGNQNMGGAGGSYTRQYADNSTQRMYDGQNMGGQNMGNVNNNANMYSAQNTSGNPQVRANEYTPHNFSNMGNAENNPPKKKGCLKGCLSGCAIIFVIFIVLSVLSMWWFEDEMEPDYDTGTNTVEHDYSSADDGGDGNGTYGVDLGLTDLRDFYTVPKGDGTDVHTIMVYLLGSDLETDGGFASSDIEEMMRADFGDNINLVIMTGGAYSWEMYEISGETCQYWQVKDGELISIDDYLGLLDMAAPETLTNFINDMAYNYPADRYSLILWNHGGGTLSGFGYDEHYPNSTLTLSSLSDAFEQSSVKFDFVGFDACLMATAETALMLEPYADYLIASQELEPGTGWHYTNWLTNLSENPSMSTLDIGVNIIDDFVEVCEDEIYNPNATLSIVELRQMPYVYTVMTDYFENSTVDIMNNEYRKISIARSDAKDFGEGGSDQIDLIDYVEKADVDGGDAVIEAVNSAVKYYNNSSDVYDAYGLAMYFPHEYIRQYSSMQYILHNVGYSAEYTRFFDVFISAMSGGQAQFNKTMGTQAEDDYSTQEWYDEETAASYEQSTEGEFLGELVIDEKDGGYVLSLTDEEWEEISEIELQVLLDDGEGYIDLGSDNVYEFDNDGDLKIEFDYTWVTLDGHTVAFYAEEMVYDNDDSWHTYGYVPAFLNDEYIEIVVSWDDKTPEGYVSGYRKYNEVGTPVGKGLFQLEAGDEIKWVIDYYTYDWEYEDYYLFGDTYTVTGNDITVSYDDVGDMDAVVYFVLTDIYNNIYETEAIIYSDY